MKASEVINVYEAFCPQEFSMEGDSRGLQIGTLDKDIQRVMVALDIREETVAEAIEKGVDLIIAKHAPIFRPIKEINRKHSGGYAEDLSTQRGRKRCAKMDN